MNNFSLTVKDKVLSALKEYSMLENTEKIVVGFSGGADSLCLLHLLNCLKEELNIKVVAAHINHGIRGEEAQRDVDFAEEFCNKNKIDFKLLEADCVNEAKKTGETLEECGRRIRYEFFNSLCDEKSKIATAHNCNDNAETVIFNVIRGSSFNGACGIPPVRDNIIRPLIYCTRNEIEGYCKENRLEYVTDSTNLSDDYTRNKIRHLILPVMEEINSGVVNNIASFSTAAKEVTSFVTKEAENALDKAEKSKGIFDVSCLLTLDKSVLKQAIVLAFNRFSDRSLDGKKIDAIYNLLFQKGRIQLFGEIYAEVVKNNFRFFTMKKNAETAETVIDDIPFEYRNGTYNIKISQYTNNSKKFNKLVLDNLIDCDKIVGKICLRTRREGDKFTFPKRKVTKSLKKLFNELNIPVENRSSLPVLCDDLGVIWIYSVGVDARCSVDTDSSNIIFVRGEDNDRQ